MPKRTPLIILLACSGLLLIAGCGDAEPGDGAKAAAQPRSQLPDDFPEDVPVYPGIVSPDVTRLGEGFEVSGVTTDTLVQIHAYYTDAFGRHGWTVDERLSETSAPGSRVYHYEKNDRAVTVVAGKEGDQTVIETAYQAKPMY